MRITRMPVRPLVLVASLFAFSAAAAQSSPKQPTPAELTAVRNDVTNLRTAQETYFTTHNAYASSIAGLGFTVSDGVTIKFVEAKPFAYAVNAYVTDKSGASCVMMIGNISAFPKTNGGLTAKAEGEVRCDGDPSFSRPTSRR